MQLRRFQAKDISSALQIVKEQLGPEAIILDTRKFTKTDPVTGKKVSFVEVIAAIDRQSNINTVEIETTRPVDRESLSPVLEEVKALKREINRLKSLIGGQADLSQTRSGLVASRIENDKFSKILSKLNLDSRSEAKLLRNLYPKGIDRPDKFVPRLRQFIVSRLQLGPTAEKWKGRCWWAVVGPTGVGKTTTLAKIAARLKFLQGKRGMLVSVDCYRLGAIDQIRRFATLMEIPLEIAKTNKELLKIFSENKDLDFILVDTTGRNPYSSTHKTELERLFNSVPGLMAQVMLSATSKKEDLMESIGFYRQFPVAGWTLTKIDETKSLITSLLPILDCDLPLSYVTNGQRVPEDIKKPKATELAHQAISPLLDGEKRERLETRIRNINVV